MHEASCVSVDAENGEIDNWVPKFAGKPVSVNAPFASQPAKTDQAYFFVPPAGVRTGGSAFVDSPLVPVASTALAFDQRSQSASSVSLALVATVAVSPPTATFSNTAHVNVAASVV